MKIEQRIFEAGSWDKPLPDLDSEHVLAFAFGAPEYKDNTTPFDDLTERYAELSLIGCSTSGEIQDESIIDNSTVVSLVTFDNTDVRTANIAVADCLDSKDVGHRLAQQLNAQGLCSVFVLSDGLAVNGTDLANGLNETLDESVVISGGLAADGSDFNETWVLVDGKPRTGYVCAVALYGENVEITCGSEGGWQPFGPERLVTKSMDNVLYELDGKPALELYKEYLGERAAGLPATALLFPLQVTDENPLVRTILSVSEADNSMTFAGDIPQGSTARLMRASEEGLIDGAETAASQTSNDASEVSLTLAVSCVGRRLAMGDNCEEEVEATKEVIGANSSQTGFYSYGELAPTGFAPCGLHNQTMTLTRISEK